MSVDDLMLQGQRSYNLEKAFNTIHVGFKREDDLPHRRFFEDPILSGPQKGVKLDMAKFNGMLDKFYDLHSWDQKTGWQTREGLEKLGMSDVAKMCTPSELQQLLDGDAEYDLIQHLLEVVTSTIELEKFNINPNIYNTLNFTNDKIRDFFIALGDAANDMDPSDLTAL